MISKKKQQVFISDISQEKPVALLIQNYLKLAFGKEIEIFVSSDEHSIPAGAQWFDDIIQNLKSSECVIVLVSQESKSKEWINFEAGFGYGKSALVIPLAIKNYPLSQMVNPLLGLQGRSADGIERVVADVAARLKLDSSHIEIDEYQSELKSAEDSLNYKTLKVRLWMEGSNIYFDLTNVGNVDLEMLMVEIWVPSRIVINQVSTGSI